MAYSIKAGVFVEQFRNIRRSRIEAMPSPKTVEIPCDGYAMSVGVGDCVLVGQVIGTSERANLHASISGRVISLDSGFVKIENDMTDLKAEHQPVSKKLSDVSSDEIIAVIREAGISADESLYKTLTQAAGKIDKIIINCCEEPPLTAIERLVTEQPASVVNGAKILLKLFGVKNAYIAIEETKHEAIYQLSRVIEGSRMISLKKVEPKHPLSDDAQIAYLLGDRPLSAKGEIYESGSAIFSAEICSMIYKAFAAGAPVTHRIITFGGDCIKKHKNLIVPIGTSVSDIVEFCGGLVRQPKYLINGGALSGEAYASSKLFVSRDTQGILLLSERAAGDIDADAPCMRCGRCADHCPMHLIPMYISEYARVGKYKKAKKYGADLCMECGVCSYVCPAARDNLSLIKKAKAEAPCALTEEEIQSANEVSDGE